MENTADRRLTLTDTISGVNHVRNHHYNDHIIKIKLFLYIYIYTNQFGCRINLHCFFSFKPFVFHLDTDPVVFSFSLPSSCVLSGRYFSSCCSIVVIRSFFFSKEKGKERKREIRKHKNKRGRSEK